MSTVTADLETWNLLQGRAREIHVAAAFRAFRDAGIEPILIKGWAASRNYPPERVRRPGDIDLVVSTMDFEQASIINRKPEVSAFNIDLHKGLRHLDTLAWEDLFEHSQLIELNGEPIRVLCEEDHLRVMATHWLIDGGGYEDKLWDIYYAVARRSSTFDWDRCLNVVRPNRRRWVVCAVGLAHHFFDLEIADLPFAREAEKLPKWIISCIEREWDRNYRLEPILTSTHDKKLLVNQITRRIPPNPIRATIEAEGDLYGRRRWIYQGKVIRNRAFPFIKDLLYFLRTTSRRSGK